MNRTRPKQMVIRVSEEEREEISKKREYLVVKGNELVQRSRFDLSLSEQKTVAYICSMIKPIAATDRASGVPYILDYDFDIREYSKICGIDYDNGKNYANVKATLQHLSDRSMWVTFPDKPDEEVLCRWLAKVRTNRKSGIAHVKIDEDLAPYLFDLGRSFTQYQLYNILGMKSAFSVRIYELAKSYAFQKSKTFDLADLKQILMVDNVKSYKDFSLFRTKVLEVAQKEINDLTDIRLYFEPITKGRKVVKIKFRIEVKTPIERMVAGAAVTERLDG